MGGKVAAPARGVDHLKIRTTTDGETYLAIGAAAKRHGLALTGHIQPYPLDDVLAAGQAAIEHGFYPPLDERPASAIPSTMRRHVRRDRPPLIVATL